MSERFYFDIESGEETIRDEEGVEAASLEEAIEEARCVIREVIDELIESESEGVWTLIVRDANGALVGRLPIKK